MIEYFLKNHEDFSYLKDNSPKVLEAILHLNENDEDFKWRWRIIDSATAKLPSLLKSRKKIDREKGKDLERRVKYLQEWCNNRIEEYFEQKQLQDESESDFENPYHYYQELVLGESI